MERHAEKLEDVMLNDHTCSRIWGMVRQPSTNGFSLSNARCFHNPVSLTTEKAWHHGFFLSILRPFVPLRLERVIVGGELVREFVHVVIAHVHHVVGDLLRIRCVFIHAKSHQSLIWSSYQMKWLYPSPTVNVNAKGLDARDENVNTKIKFAAVDQVRQIHVPGKIG